MVEIWKSVKEFPYYEISNKGNVRSIDRWVKQNGRKDRFCKGCVKTISKNPNGYLMVLFSEHHKTYTKYIHRLVAEHFVENPESEKVVNHIDGNKENNNYDNLEWVDYSKNSLHSYNVLKQRKPKSCGTSFPIIVTDKNGVKTEYASVKEAVRNLSISQTQIHRLLRSNKMSKYGYTFKFKNNNDVEDIEKVE